ncbi:MAG: hypothetical protein CM1200mP14_25770 [Gammaproteobacteria bacterium]|nr:MAG: hypothetical protein CM1200mP14_25770 [Gammaproteobacteria bacterium]
MKTAVRQQPLENLSARAGSCRSSRDISIKIETGDFVAMAGPSGSGKTTMLNMIGGLTRPSQGQISIGDQEITEMMIKI